ncbi:hypothetical protein Hdeb2414_s0023g00629621 [Helianthus debilis subsp. tardiflorus]
MVMHMVVIALAFGVFQTKKIDFFTFHPKVFHKLLLTQNYLFFFFTFNLELLSFAIYTHNFFYFQL